MAVVTKSIGATGRDHSTIAAWEALLDDDPTYDAGDNAVGELFNDADFTEAITINGGATIGLADITLQAAAGEGHTGTPNTGVRVFQAAAHNFSSALTTIIRNIDFDANGFNVNPRFLNRSGNQDTEMSGCLIHNVNGNRVSLIGMFTLSGGSASARIYNNAVFDISQSNVGGIDALRILTQTTSTVYNNTVTNIVSTSGSGNVTGLDYQDDVDMELKNNLVTDISGGASAVDYGDSAPSNADTATNGSEDATSPNSALRNLSITYEDAASEDFRLAAGDTDAIDDGTDLGAGVFATDILGRDRDAEGDIWDLGAFEFVVTDVLMAQVMM